jgi:hypothetical protein
MRRLVMAWPSEAAEQDAAQGVADGDAIARLQRAELEGAALVIGFDHHDLVRSLEIKNGHVFLGWG